MALEEPHPTKEGTLVRRFRKFKTDWLFADTIQTELAFNSAGGSEVATYPLLPTEYIDQLSEGECTLLRIVGDLYVWWQVGLAQVSAQPVLGFTLALLRTQVDDTGVVSQIDVDPFEPPDLAASAAVGGARDFLWSRNFIWINGGAAGARQPPYGSFQAYSSGHSNFDVRVKRRLKTGEGIVLQAITGSDAALPDNSNSANAVLTYRILVKTGRK